MKMTFIVEVELGRVSAQPMREFATEDFAAAAPYLAKKISDSLDGASTGNAFVDSVSMTAHVETFHLDNFKN